MYTFRVIDNSFEEEYERFVVSHPKGHILQTTAWGEVKRGMGWIPLKVAIFEDGQIKGSMQLLKRKIPLPILNRSILYSPRGPVIDINDTRLLDQLLTGVKSVAHDHRAIFLKIDPDVPHDNKPFENYLLSRHFKRTQTAEGFEGVQPTYVFRLNIEPEEEQLLAAMSNKTRYNLRLAEKKGVKIRHGREIQDLKKFYVVLQETAKRDRFLIRGYEYFEMIWIHLAQNGLAQLFLAEYEGEIIAGSLAFILGDKAWYIYGASGNSHRNVMPNYFLQWAMIRWAKENGCKIYDFRGVSSDISEDNPLYGLYRFKKGFGGEFTQFIGEWDLVYNPFFYWLWTRALPVYYRTIRKIKK
ncbi:MAG: lipid II:glycine glycyltransferase FemX [Chitinophagales bacterium]